MSCSDLDLKAYLLGEATGHEQRQTQDHLAGCQACREELERLRLTQAALFTLRDEEVPRRIAFVSDKVFEPRWYVRFWDSAPRLVFASSAMLSVALLALAFLPPMSPARAPVAAIDQAALESRVQAEVERRLEAAVKKATAESDERHRRQTAELLAAAERRWQLEHRADMLAVEETFNVLRKRMNILLTASADLGGPQ